MAEASNGKVEENTLKEVAETGDERKDGAVEENGEHNYKAEVQSARGVSVIDGNSGEAMGTRREKEAKDSSSSSSSSSSSDDEEEDDGEKDEKEEKVIPLAEVEEIAVAQTDAAVSVEHVVAVEAAAEVPEKVDAAAVEEEEETEAQIPSGETANGVVLAAGDEETAPVAVDESDVAVLVAAAAAEERAKEELVLAAEEEENARDSLPAAADAAPKERGEDSSLVQPPADAPAISKGGVAAEDGADEGEIPESTGSPPIISVSRRTVSPTSWRSCCGLFDVLRRSDR